EFAAAQQKQAGGDNPFSTLGEKNLEQQVKAIERLFDEADQITIGWKIDRSAKNTHLDFTFTGVPGKLLAQEMNQMADAKTNYAGFLMPEAAVTANFCAVKSTENVEQAITTLEQLKAKAEQAIDKDPNLPEDKRSGVKNVLRELLDVAEK